MKKVNKQISNKYSSLYTLTASNEFLSPVLAINVSIVETIQHISVTVSLTVCLPFLASTMRRPNHPTHFACKVCDKVCVGTHDMVRHFQSSHMRDNKSVNEAPNLKTYPNYLDRVPNFLRRNLSYRNPNPNATCNGFQPIQHYPSIVPNPNSIASRVPSVQVITIPSSSLHPLLPSILPKPQPTPPQPHVPTTSVYYFQHSPSLASPLLPFATRNRTFGEKISIQEVDRDCTKPLIDKLDRPILEGIKSNEENAGNGFNSKIDLTLKL